MRPAHHHDQQADSNERHKDQERQKDASGGVASWLLPVERVIIFKSRCHVTGSFQDIILFGLSRSGSFTGSFGGVVHLFMIASLLHVRV